jgi:outer membrane protein assembly factor BamD (BamD/ComL family)
MIRRHLLCIFSVFLAATVFGDAYDWKPEASWGPYRERGTGKLIKKAEKAEAKGNYKKALGQYRKIEKESVNVKNKAKALVKQGDCLREMKEPWKAFGKYRVAVDEYRSYIPFNDVLLAEYEISGHFGEGGKKDSVLWLKFSTDEKAVEVLDHIVEVGPYSEIAPKAMYRVALIRMAQEDFESAIQRLKSLLHTYPRSDIAKDARLELARALLREAQAGDGDGTLTSEGRSCLDRFIERYPDHERIQEARDLAVEAKDIEAGRLLALSEFYMLPAHSRPEAAKGYLRRIVMEYSETSSALIAQILLTSLQGADPQE